VKFTNPGSRLDDAQIDVCLSVLGIRIPRPLRELYLASNGGVPEPYVFQTDQVETVVSAFLPLMSSWQVNACKSYLDLVIVKKMVPPNFFPFAIVGGGDYFLVDINTEDGRVFLYRGDTAAAAPLLPFNMTVDQFWASLRPE
jgi:SMI1 / KNR4 family (SUKH-1)